MYFPISYNYHMPHLAYPTETELEAERQQSASLTSQIDQAQLKLAELKKSEKATANRDPILSLFAK